MHAELFNFFRASFSAEQFRRWIRQLGPDGGTLAQQLPDNQVSALTLFDVGADLLIRNNYIDAAFFAALAREFPMKADEVAGLAARCSALAAPSLITTKRPARLAASALALAVVLGLGGALAWRLWPPPQVEPPPPSSTAPPVEPPQPLAPTNKDATVLSPAVDKPGAATGPVGPIEAEKTVTTGPAGGKTERPHKPDTTKTMTHELRPDKPVTPVTPPPVQCTISEKVRGDLGALARTLLTSEGVTEEFTVTLHEGASIPDVSPPPGPGQSTRKQLHDRLRALRSAELGRCRDIPIDVEFTKSKTTLTPRPH